VSFRSGLFALRYLSCLFEMFCDRAVREAHPTITFVFFAPLMKISIYSQRVLEDLYRFDFQSLCCTDR